MRSTTLRLNEVDRIVLRRAANLKGTRRRTGFALSSGAVAAVALAAARQWGGLDVLFWLSLSYVALATFDKALHGFAILAHQRLVRKLAAQLDPPRGGGATAEAPEARP